MTERNYLQQNRMAWDTMSIDFAEPGRRSWGMEEFSWGMFGVPESTVKILPGALSGQSVIELGCGTAYIAAWFDRQGALPVGIDNSPKQLANARLFQQEFNQSFPLILGDAERTPFRYATFDLAISEYGASIWCDSFRWIAEAARLLRPGGELIFLRNSDLMILCSPLDESLPVDTQLHRSPFGMHRFDWQDDGSVEFHLPHGDLLRLLLSSGFEILDLVELQAPETATNDSQWMSVKWAKAWPCEEIWRVRKR